MKTIKIVLLAIALLSLYACRHPIEIVGEGDVLSASGGRTCLLEDFQAGLDNCSKNTVDGAYQETYYAVPRAGWQFDHWGSYCTDKPSPECSFNISAQAVRDFWGKAVPPLQAVFTPIAPLNSDARASLASLLSGTASISLVGSSSRVSLTTDNEWSLSKTGSLSGTTVTWNITATKTATTSGHLVVQGTMTVTNTGTGPATIGNIVVNLQKRTGNSWVTRASDIANATQGDDATTANIHKAASSENKATFSETAGASGELEFMDATNNTLFSLVPQVLIGSGQTRTLLFSASFNNNHAALNLTPGTQIRAEVIVTFGNATTSGNSTANVDINGNGALDADEARVRSVPSRLTLTVPAAVNGNSTPTLTDTIDDIAKTGTVTFTNAQFNLGATSGTVTATVAGGVDGGTITNCAHLTTPDITVTSGGSTFTTVPGMNLQKCSQVQVPGSGTPPPCTPGTPGCAWNANDLVTYSQTQWGFSSTAAGALLNANFASLYGSDFEVGGLFTINFRTAGALFNYLPDTFSAGVLTGSLVDPSSSSGGELAGEVIALQLNVDFSAGNLVPSLFSLGDLYLCNTGFANLDGRTVNQFLVDAHARLGGGSSPISLSLATPIARALNEAFADGTPSSVAQTNLFSAPCTN